MRVRNLGFNAHVDALFTVRAETYAKLLQYFRAEEKNSDIQLHHGKAYCGLVQVGVGFLAKSNRLRWLRRLGRRGRHPPGRGTS